MQRCSPENVRIRRSVGPICLARVSVDLDVDIIDRPSAGGPTYAARAGWTLQKAL
jgi:hypothetical protein